MLFCQNFNFDKPVKLVKPVRLANFMALQREKEWRWVLQNSFPGYTLAFRSTPESFIFLTLPLSEITRSHSTRILTITLLNNYQKTADQLLLCLEIILQQGMRNFVFSLCLKQLNFFASRITEQEVNDHCIQQLLYN